MLLSVCQLGWESVSLCDHNAVSVGMNGVGPTGYQGRRGNRMVLGPCGYMGLSLYAEFVYVSVCLYVCVCVWTVASAQ